MEAKLEGKRWSKDFEEPIRAEWKKNKVYAFVPDAKKPVFSIDTPPPYVNAPIHIGHATVYTIMDIIARFRRMTGFNVLFPIGLDRNGLPIEIATERKFNIKLSETPREKFIEFCKKTLDESSTESLHSLYMLGHSYCSWELGKTPGSMYYTDSDDYRQMTQETFIDLWNKGLIYLDERVNNFCPSCKTTIADSEIDYKEYPTMFSEVRFKIKGTSEYATIATTRPELLCSCAILLFNPEDERYKHLEGKTAIVPIFGQEVPIKAHPYAKMDAGTGLMMMASFGDYTDIRFFRENNLEPIIAIGADGKMNEKAGPLKGLTVGDARKKVLELLREEGALGEQEKLMHRTPVCERCKTPIEFIAMPEYYLKQLDMKDEIRDVSKKISFYAPESKRILDNWIDTISMDWAISRRRYYATELPIWYCENCGEVIVPPKGKYYRPWKENPPIEKCPKCGGTKFKGDERVFDTWFDSSISPLYVLNYPHDKGFFENSFPCSLRPQGKEIVRTWLYYTVLRCYQLTGKPVFQDTWIHYHVVDEKGNKFSKSAGNAIDPMEIIDKYGAEPFRLWAVLEGDITRIDLRCSFERIEGASKFLTKLWNVSRFVSMFPQDADGYELTPSDRWILGEMDKLARYAKEHFYEYDFHEPVQMIKHFIWETFASHYIEMAKNRAYNQNGDFSEQEQKGALYTLHTVLKTILKIMAPVTPFITQKIYRDVYGGDIHKKAFPEGSEDEPELPFSKDDVISFNSAIWKAKKDNGLSLKNPVKKVVAPKNLEILEKELKLMHGIEEMEFGEELSITL
ncbi:MAG: valine--tRNA ligase [Candidatus Micrarchaeota archaeon]|nr:valine--tRNA ligase [Candidatus Micrarchaeota archaeon]